MACFPWIVPHAAHGQRLAEILRWFEAIRARPAVVKAYGDSKDVYTGQTLLSPFSSVTGSNAQKARP